MSEKITKNFVEDFKKVDNWLEHNNTTKVVIAWERIKKVLEPIICISEESYQEGYEEGEGYVRSLI
jgi:hypothetical protein